MRDTANIAAAFDSIQGMQKDSQLQGFPTGHFVGFFIDIEDGAVKIGPGEANVGGTEVIQRTTNTLEENSWAITRERGYMYYIYLKRDGLYWVDNQDPGWDSLLAGWYHPLLRYRYIGKVFNDTDGKIIYKLSAHHGQQSMIVVGAKGFTGYMDYECDGVDDQEEINLALKFASESGGETGGVVHLTRGYFYTTAAIEGRSNCILGGEGQGATFIKKNGLFYGIYVVGTSTIPIQNFCIRNMTLSKDASDTNDRDLIYAQYTNNMNVLAVYFDGGVGGCYALSYCTNFTVKNCTFDNCSKESIYVGAGSTPTIEGNTIYGDGESAATYGISVVNVQSGFVINNVVKDVCATGNYYPIFCDIATAGYSNSLVSGNDIHNIKYRTTGELLINGAIQVAESQELAVSNNMIHDCEPWGIRITRTASYNALVSSNRVSSNGSCMDRGNCESTTPPYLTGETDDTQVNCTFAGSSATAAYSGSYSYLLTKTAATGTQARSYFHLGTATSANMHGLVAGCEYKFTGYFKVPTGVGTASAFYVGFAANAGAWASNTQALADTYDTWQGVSLTGLPTTTATAVALFLGATASATLNSLVYVDHIRLAPIGVHNEHSQNFSDSGTATRTSGNSWQSPFQV